MQTADIVVIGAGVIGLAVAYELARSGTRVTIIERNELPAQGSTAACTGGIRLQFSSEPNIRFSKIGLERFAAFSEEFGTDIGLKQNGYLFLLPRGRDLELYAQGHRLQRCLGVKSVFMDRQSLMQIIPFVCLEDVTSGSLCRSEGHADPHAVVEAYIHGLRRHNIAIQTDTELTGISTNRSRITSVSTNKGDISTNVVAVCAGPESAGIAGMAGVNLPLVSKKRHVVAIMPPSLLPEDLPLIVDSDSGWYLKAEPGGIALVGGTDRDVQPACDTLPEQNVVDRIVEATVRRAPRLADAGIIRTIVGLRCMSPDDHACIGRMANIEGLYCAAGFSGHGFMHAPAAGMALSELIATGQSAALAGFDPRRFERDSTASAPERYVF